MEDITIEDVELARQILEIDVTDYSFQDLVCFLQIFIFQHCSVLHAQI
jgi:hypothetical protein